MRTYDDSKVLSYFPFLTQMGFTLSRSYDKGTDSTCTQIYRFARDNYNYIEYRVLSEKECSLVVCVMGKCSYPNLRLRYAGLVRKRKLARFFRPSLREEWLLDAELLKRELTLKGSLFGMK